MIGSKVTNKGFPSSFFFFFFEYHYELVVLLIHVFIISMNCEHMNTYIMCFYQLVIF